jgi:hypothetical protein
MSRSLHPRQRPGSSTGRRNLSACRRPGARSTPSRRCAPPPRRRPVIGCGESLRRADPARSTAITSATRSKSGLSSCANISSFSCQPRTRGTRIIAASRAATDRARSCGSRRPGPLPEAGPGSEPCRDGCQPGRRRRHRPRSASTPPVLATASSRTLRDTERLPATAGRRVSRRCGAAAGRAHRAAVPDGRHSPATSFRRPPLPPGPTRPRPRGGILGSRERSRNRPIDCCASNRGVFDSLRAP